MTTETPRVADRSVVAESDAGSDERSPRTSVDRATRNVRWASVVGVLVGAVPFFATLMDFRWDPLRGATAFRYAETFFDIQADSLREGRFSVPDGSLGIEGFLHDGHTYTYFGIFPALLRVPVQLVTHEFDGRLTLASMALAWMVFAVMTARLFWLVRSACGRTSDPTRTELAVATVFLAAATGGTSLTYDASLPWAYHEVYLWSVASVVGASYWLLRVLLQQDPPRRDVRWLLTLVMVASLTRTTGGWAMCLATIAGALWVRRAGGTHWRRILLAGVVPLAVAVAINMIKFRHPYMFPLQDQVFTELNAHRRKVLAENGGSLVGLQFFPTSLVHYFRPDGIRFVDYFPWITFPPRPATGYGAEIDQGYRTGSVTAFMPLLLVLALGSLVALVRRLPSRSMQAVRIVWVGAILVTGGVMAYGYIAFRYTSEFVPALVLGAMVTVHCTARWLAARPRLARQAVVALAALVTVFSIGAELAVGHQAAAATYKGQKLESYLSRQVDLSGGTAAYRRLVGHGDGVPTGAAAADHLWIRGDCEALYYSDGGNDNVPWMLVEERDVAVTVRTTPDVSAGVYPLMHHSTDPLRRVSLRITRQREAQVVVQDGTRTLEGQLFDLPPYGEVRVGARNLSELGSAEISSTPGGFVTWIPTALWADENTPVLTRMLPNDPADFRPSGVVIEPAPTLPLSLCPRVARAAGITLPSGD